MVEKIQDIGCSFRVFRRRKSKNVITISLWKSSIGYVFNLSHGMVWWARHIKELYPGWNVRFYVDYSIYSPMRNDVDWHSIVEQVKKHENVELWFYFCEWGHTKKAKCGKCHSGTFGGLIRFHAFEDPEVEVALSRNVELLTSEMISKIEHFFVNSPNKQFHVYYDVSNGYSCKEGAQPYGKLCEELKIEGTNMILATFGFRKNRNLPNPVPNFFYRARQIIFNTPELRHYPYGVDEIILTQLYKSHMTKKNTFVTPRLESISSLLPNRDIYTSTYFLVLDTLNYILSLFPPEKQIDKKWFYHLSYINRLPLIDIFTNNFKWITMQIKIILSKFLRDYPHLVFWFFNKYPDKPRSNKDINYIHNLVYAQSDFYFRKFIKNKIQPGKSLKTFDEFATTEKQARLFFYMGLQYCSFDELDFIGYYLKNKRFGIETKIEEDPLNKSNIHKKITQRLRLFSTGKDRQKIIDKIKREIERDKQEKEIQEKLFHHKISETYLD